MAVSLCDGVLRWVRMYEIYLEKAEWQNICVVQVQVV